MAKKNKKEKKEPKNKSENLENLFNTLMNKISPGTFDVDDINSLNIRANQLINQELDQISDHNGSEISSFYKSIMELNKSYRKGDDISSLFESDGNNISKFISSEYSDKYALYNDLHSISSKLFELEEAINVTRDSILTAEENDRIISRVINFNTSDEMNSDYLRKIEILEDKYDLHSKIRDYIVPNTLIYGTSYTYTIPYTKIIEDHLNKSKSKNGKVAITPESALFKETFSEDIKSRSFNVKDFGTVTVENNPIPLSVINESVDHDAYYDLVIESILPDKEFKNIVTDVSKKSNKINEITVDGVKTDKDFNLELDSNDLYIETLNPTNIVPLKMMNNTIGYYYIYNNGVYSKPKQNIMGATNILNNENDDNIIDKYAQMIVKSIDNKFVKDNIKFKEHIVGAIKLMNIKENNIGVQFIPPEYITEFKIKLNEKGEGVSMLNKSLFYAKLYLALLIFKLTSIIARSNDTRVYYVKQFKGDTDASNKIQETIRQNKTRELNFNDIMSTNTIENKIGAMKDLYIPTSADGNRGVEMDILSGQSVDLNTDLMEMLKTNMISSTSVPSVILNFINEADYSRSIVQGNTKYIGMVINLQKNFNLSITNWYKQIIQFENVIEENSKVQASDFTYSLNKPKFLNDNNIADTLNNVESKIAFIIKALNGDQGEKTEDDNKFHDIMFKKLAKHFVPTIDWSLMEEIYDASKIELSKKLSDKTASSEDE